MHLELHVQLHLHDTYKYNYAYNYKCNNRHADCIEGLYGADTIDNILTFTEAAIAATDRRYTYETQKADALSVSPAHIADDTFDAGEWWGSFTTS